MAKAILKRLGVMSVAKLEAVVFAVVGLIEGILFAIISSIISSVAGLVGIGGMGSVLGFGSLSIVIFPIAFGIIGFIAGAIGAFLYNLITGWIGGIEIDLEEKQ